MTERSFFLIRHGESVFNATFRNDGVDPMLFDAPLTARGHAQAAEARLTMRERRVDVVITSPLTRALQTTLAIFGDHPSRPVLSVETGHRERLESSCDQGRSVTELRRDFPALAFDHLPETWWHDEGEPDGRGLRIEPLDVMLARMRDFTVALHARRETAIAVVGHATFFHHLTGRWLDNCEIVTWNGVVGALAA